MDKKIVIGLVGKQGSGKNSFVENLKKIMSDETVDHVKSGGTLMAILRILSIPITRQNLQNLADSLKNSFGDDVISKAICSKIEESSSNIVVFDAVRWQSDLKVIRQFQGSILVYINTDKDIRYQRLRNRGEKEDEKELSLEKFEKAEVASTEIEIDDIGLRADFMILNNTTEEDFFEGLRFFCKTYLPKKTS